MTCGACIAESSATGTFSIGQGWRPCYSKETAKVTSKLQVTIPKIVAERCAISPGDEIELVVSAMGFA
jgi:AbrB family looped-hinge helix DNA binding protein